MTREEARQQAAEDYCNNLIREATFGQFVAHKAGSKWADEHPISYDGKAMLYVNNKSHENGYKEAVDKACEWLDDYLTFSVAEWDEGVTTQRVIDKFRKAMGGGE